MENKCEANIVFFSAKAWTWLDVTFLDVHKYNFQLCNKTVNECVKEKWVSKKKPQSLLYYLSVILKNTKLSKRLISKFMMLSFDKEKIAKDGTNTLFIFFNGCTYEKDERFHKLLRKKYPKAKLVFLIDDSKTFRASNAWEYARAHYDDIMSVNMMDSIEFGTFYYQEPLPKRITDTAIKTDLFFVGSDRGRREKLEAVADYLSDKGMKLDFLLLADNVERKNPLIKYIKEEIDYDVLQNMMDETNCILEITPKNSRVATTMRAVEAVAYGKKLLTNNPLIKNSPIYNSCQMRMFEKPEDIDIEWLRSNDKTGFSDPETVSPESTLDTLAAHYCNNK